MKILLCCLIASFILSGCHKAEDVPTAEQAAQLESLRQATVAQLQSMLGRELTASEKQCIVVRLVDGKLDSHLNPPLSETVKIWAAMKREDSTPKPGGGGKPPTTGPVLTTQPGARVQG